MPKRTDLGNLPPYNSPANKKKLYVEQEGHCNGCQNEFSYVNMTIDHIIDRAYGGTDHIENLQLLCGYCNSVKGDRGQEYLLAKLAS
ncbi:MAG: HNH endonuclease signature motif containing protein [Gammaproteobacteria bacterium]|nr:HNH endonuclease signature motif containing protein [Gammaproteobacteria bacterium]